MFLPLAAVVAIALAWSVYWYVAFTFAQAESARRREAWSGQGLQLTCKAETWGGYPFRIEYACLEPVVVVLGHTFSAASLRAYAQAYDPWHILVLAEGPSRLQTPSGAAWTASHQTGRASIRFRGRTEPEISIEFPELNVEGLLTAKRLLLHSRPEPAGTHGIALSAAALNFQPVGRPPFPIRSVEFIGTLNRDGAVDVHDVRIEEQGVTLAGSGSVGLDGQHRLAGVLHAETNNLDGVLAILEPHLRMNEQQRAALKAMLTLLIRDSKADISARDGELYIGPFKAADLAPLY